MTHDHACTVPSARSPCHDPAHDPPSTLTQRARRLAVLFALAAPILAGAATPVGRLTLPEVAPDGPVTVFYPTEVAEAAVQRGPFTLSLAANAQPALGNRRLVVMSHGSGGSPWEPTDTARALDLDRVGVYGMSAGGHTALSMAGGSFSRAGFKRLATRTLPRTSRPVSG